MDASGGINWRYSINRKMTSLMPKPVAGHVVPGTTSPNIQVLKPWGWQQYILRAGIITETPHGPPIKKEPIAKPAPVKPKDIGDEGHHAIMQKLGALISQNTTQITDALPASRLWR